ncbi:MAG: BCCT family transporter [Desulfurispora sp.]|uniref:BCCT family transporter n=1 Tax=Desulfurispora sp. TaxID=3014275 RepID=UPI004049B10B
MKGVTPPDRQTATVNYPVLGSSLLLCLAIYAPMIWGQSTLQKHVDYLLHILTHSLDWLWQLGTFALLCYLIWLALGPYGRVKLGHDRDKPDFSTFTWLSMIFFGGIGSSLVYWSCLEPIYYYTAPPFQLPPCSPQAAGLALAYGMFHWGFTAWAIFALPAVAFAYSYFVRRQPYLSPSFACHFWGKTAPGQWWAVAVDTFVLVSLVGGAATAMGFNVPMYSAVAASWLGRDSTLAMQICFLLLLTALFAISNWQGLKAGIARLSRLATWGIMLLIIFVLISGPTHFMLALSTENLGNLLDNYWHMSLYTDPVAQSGFPQDWTIFYWAWWAAWAIYMGLFTARISRGRTIRELITALLLVGSAGTAVFYMTFGAYTLHLLIHQGVDLAALLAQKGGESVVVYILNQLPLNGWFLPLFLMLMLIFSATSFDSNAYTMAMISCRQIRDGQEPPRPLRFCWSLVLCGASLALLLVGGLKVVQLSSVLTSLPILFILFLLSLSLNRWLKEDFGSTARPLLVAEKTPD